MATLFYFAYGSNLHPVRLGKRLSSARPVGPVKLDGHELRFHKRGFLDGSGKCTLVAVRGQTMHGAIYALSEADRASLDRFEGVGKGYEVIGLSLDHGGKVYDCFTYQATADALDSSLLPYDWYKQLVIAGTRYYSFPEEYIEPIQRVPGMEDADLKRVAEHGKLLEEMLDHPRFPEEEAPEKL